MRFCDTVRLIEDGARAIDVDARVVGLSRRFLTDDATGGETETGWTTLAFSRHTLVRQFSAAGYRRNDPVAQRASGEIGSVTDDVLAAWDSALAAGVST